MTDMCAWQQHIETAKYEEADKLVGCKEKLLFFQKPVLTLSKVAVPTLFVNNSSSVLAWHSEACKHMALEYLLSQLTVSHFVSLASILSQFTLSYARVRGRELKRLHILFSSDVSHSVEMLHRKTYHIKVWTLLFSCIVLF